MKFYIQVEVNDKLSVEFYADFIEENNGIGSYEYWGFKGYDKGRDYWAIDSSVEWDETKHTAKENKLIKKYLEANEDKLETELYNKTEKFKPSDYF